MSHETFQAPEPEQLAALLPAYDFHAFIAQGGMGAVYKASQRSLDRDVAIKILPRELGEDPSFRQSFEIEAKAMARLNHPNLIGVYDYGSVDGMPYIVMEYVNGKSLYHSAWNTAVAPDQAVEIVRAICLGLAHAHENGVIHRDIKPANILLTPKAEPKIGDFGLALNAEGGGSGLHMGTPGYTAPEFLENPEAADARADLYAVGVILHELVTAERPDASGKLSETSTGDRNLDAIWHRATQADPDHRFQSAAEMAAALGAWTPAPGPRQLVASKAPPATPKRPVPARSTTVAVHIPRSNGPLVRNLLIIAGLILAIGVTWKVYQAKVSKNDQTKEENRIAREKAAEINAKNAEEARRQAEAARRSGKPEPGGNTESFTPEPEPELPPMESLAELRLALRQGERKDMPTGTERHGNSYWFLVPEPMTWHQAATFAEDHGGHLPLFDSATDIAWLSQKAPHDAAMWLGAGRSGSSRWIMADGAPWPLDKSPRGLGEFATLNDLGVIRAGKATDKLPFFIQWHTDGSNPATLDQTLAHTRSTLEGHDPDFPPGTLPQEARHFTVVLRTVTRAEAARFAEKAGATLAIPATADEADWLAERVAGLPAPHGLWLGASRRGTLWQWDSGETWELDRWAEDLDHSDANSALVLLPGKGWSPGDPTGKASGFILEWSRDARHGGTAEVAEDGGAEPVQGMDEANELRDKAKDLVAKAIADRDAKLKKNAEDLVWDINGWIRGLNTNELAQWGPHVAKLKKIIRDDHVPFPKEVRAVNNLKMSPQMAKACDWAVKKEKEHLAECNDKIETLRRAYSERILAQAEEADAKAQKALADALRKEAAKAKDADTWLRALEGKEAEEADDESLNSAPPLSNPDSIVGRWQWHSGQVVQLNRDGTAFPDPGNAHISWEAIDGTQRGFAVTWDHQWIDRLTLSIDGRSLNGRNNVNTPIWAVRIDATPKEDPSEDPILGGWDWSTGVVVDFLPNGNARNDEGLSGTWELSSIGGNTRYYRVVWAGRNEQWQDVLGLSPNRARLKGSNGDGMQITAERRGGE